ncbi:MAG TPA: lysine--tRNA ligase [Pyrinomonadaceae bacterium]|nr:lysine--tRNA ligase [Pyrinomonadaceae bacterium]
MSNSYIEENDQTRARREHLEAIRGIVGNVYPNKFERSRVTGTEDTITAIVNKFKDREPQVEEGSRPAPEELESINKELNAISVRTSGRIATPPRVMGKAAFVHLSDGVSRLQIYVKKTDVRAVENDTGNLINEEGAGWELFNLLDHGDFIGVEGFLFVTKTGELSIHVRELQFLSKALLPMPDKLHGLTDPEIRQRQRYADLIAGSLKVEREAGEWTPREIFELRSKVIRELRRFLDDHGYVEVETPMLTPLATGAAAKPFETYHNALGIPLYARIAPELYLKRLLVGGFEKVYELNRNFRNEGIGYRWNPEFTMLEFYCAYMDVNGMMDFCEEMLQTAIEKAAGSLQFEYAGLEIDFSRPFSRLAMKKAISDSFPRLFDQMMTDVFGWQSPGNNEKWLDDPMNVTRLRAFMQYQENVLNPLEPIEKAILHVESSGVPDESLIGQYIAEIFERLVETSLIQPTFITDFPKSISPLSKASPKDRTVAERFELYVANMELANGFSELNDPVEQRERFLEQMQQRERGDEEAMVLDEDYIRALSYGMPPAAGIGIGIDRLLMILTNKHTIREVILFPHMRPERKAREEEETSQEKE